MDIEAVVARRLSEAVGVPGRVEVTADAPESFISVERLGGGGSMFEAAQALSEKVKAAVCDLDEEPNVFHPEVTNCYRQNDPDTGRSRYIVQAQLWVCE